MDDYYSDNQPELIHCKFCGEDYAATYKACPFCHTAPNGKKVGSRSGRSSHTGNRVKTNTRGGGYGGARSPLSIVGIVLSIILVIAAVVIVVVLVRSALSNRTEPQVDSSNDIITSQDDGGADASSPDQGGEDGTQTVAPNGVTLDQTAVNLEAGGTLTLTAAVDPTGWVGQVVWTSSDSSVATVDASGLVSYVGDGTCTITASAGGVTASCAVTCGAAAGGDAPADDGTATGASAIVVTAYGNTMDGDFTLNLGEAVPFRATGGDGSNYTWSIADPGIASVDPNTGSCTGLAEGKTTMTVSSGGQSTTVTIRVKS